MTNNEKDGNFSPFVAACFTLNYVIGAGILTTPWAFYQAGIVLTTFVVMGVGIIAIMASDYLLSAMARADAVCKVMMQEKELEWQEDGTEEKHSLIHKASGLGSYTNQTLKSPNNNFDDDDDVTGAMTTSSYQQSPHISSLSETSSSLATTTKTTTTTTITKPKLMVQDRKFELTEMCHLFLGEMGFRVYLVSITLYLYGLNWAYTSVFAHAMERSLPLFGEDDNDGTALMDSYHVYVLVYAMIVVPLSCLDLSEQIVVQVSLSVCRLIIIGFIVVTPLLATLSLSSSSSEEIITEEEGTTMGYFGTQTTPQGAPLFCFDGIGKMLPIAVFGAVFHHGIPGLAQEVKRKDQLGNIFGMTLLICTAAYTIIGVVDAWYFGDLVNASVNLNWANYHGLGGGWMSKLISVYTVAFPAFDVISAFPLNAIVLSNSLMGEFRRKSTSSGIQGEEQHHAHSHAHAHAHAHAHHQKTKVEYAFRLLSCVPPIIGGFFVRELSMISDYTGLAGLAIGFCFPALLYVASRRKALQMQICPDTFYDRFGSRGAEFVFVFGIFAICFNLYELV